MIITRISSGFSYAFSPEIFFTIRGCENVHIYFWIAKDLGWILNNKIGIFFGLLALLWLGVLLYHAIKNKNNEEKYFLVPTFLWLFANFLWMTGNLLYGTDVYRFPAGCLMMIGLVMIVYYFVSLKNKEMFIPDEKVTKLYNQEGLIPRFSFFNTWRRYEFCHVFFWLLKDYSWCSGDKMLWFVGAIPTLIVSFDFVITSSVNKKMTVDMCHYIAQLLWIFSNLTWALVELFNVGSDNGLTYYRGTDHPNGRYVASIILIFAYLPIVLLYLIWLPLTITGKINTVTLINSTEI